MSCPIDCSNRTHIPGVKLEANGDIAGPGVIIGFVGNAYLSLLLLTLYYLVSFDPLAHPFGLFDVHHDTTTQTGWWQPSPVDTWLLGIVRRNVRRVVQALGFDAILLHDAKELEPRFVSSIIHMCDLQLLTGFAILVSAYIEVPCSMSAYHWQIIVYLAWFSSITHLAGLVAARRYLHGRPWARFGRIAASVMFLIMLLVAIAPTTYFNWDTVDGQIGATEMSSSVACLYDPAVGPAVWMHRGQEAWEECTQAVEARLAELHEQYPSLKEMMTSGTASDVGLTDDALMMVRDPRGGCRLVEPLPVTSSASFQSMLYSVILLGWAFLSRFIRLWVPLFRFITMRFSRPVVTWIHRLTQRLESNAKRSNSDGNSPGVSYYLFNRPLFGWLIFLQLNMDCLSSMFGELFWLTILIVWGTLKLMATISFARESGKVEGEQDWNFGQTLPVLLLVGPLLMVTRSFTTTRVKQDPRREWQEPCLSRETTLHQDQERFVPHEPTMTRRMSSDAHDQVRDRAQYKSSTWKGACLVSTFFSFSLMIAMSFGSSMELHEVFHPMRESIFMVWVHELQLIVYILWYYPLTTHLSILAGLFHDDLCGGALPPRSDNNNDDDKDGRDDVKGVSHTCGHAKWLAMLIFFLTILFPAMLWVCQLQSVSIPGLKGSTRVVVLGIAVYGFMYMLGGAVVLCCRRRSRSV